MSKLAPCPACGQFVRVTDATCPFCSASPPTTQAVGHLTRAAVASTAGALGLALAVGACAGESPGVQSPKEPTSAPTTQVNAQGTSTASAASATATSPAKPVEPASTTPTAVASSSAAPTTTVPATASATSKPTPTATATAIATGTGRPMVARYGIAPRNP
ncbi:MAG: hypothetical protein U0165_19035 [Polyangiaceae bacterium]